MVVRERSFKVNEGLNIDLNRPGGEYIDLIVNGIWRTPGRNLTEVDLELVGLDRTFSTKKIRGGKSYTLRHGIEVALSDQQPKGNGRVVRLRIKIPYNGCICQFDKYSER